MFSAWKIYRLPEKRLLKRMGLDGKPHSVFQFYVSKDWLVERVGREFTGIKFLVKNYP